MALYHVRTTGSKSSGASTADIWTDANCYPTLVAALTVGGDGDEFILNDETHEVDDIAGTNWVGDRIISSRSGAAANCIVQTPAADAISKTFVCNPGSAGSLVVNNIKLTRPAAVTSAGTTLIQLSGSMGDLTLNGCILGDFDCAPATGAPINVLIYSATGTARTVTLTNCAIQNVSITSTDSYAGLYRQQNDGDSLVMTNVTMTNITRSVNTANDVIGWWYISDGDVTLTNVTISNYTATQANAVGSNRALIYGSSNTSNNALAVDGFTISDGTFSGGSSGVQGLHWAGSYVVENLTATNCISTSEANNTGLLFLATGNSAAGTGKGFRVTGCEADFGLAFYVSSGGSIEAENVIVSNCSLSQGGVYFGGDGQSGTDSLIGYVAYNLTTRAVPRASETAGLGLYAHNNGDVNRTINLYNITIADCVNSENEAEGIYINNLSATHSLAVNIYSALCWNGGENDREIGGGVDAGGGLTVVTYNCATQNGAASIVDANTTNNDLVNLTSSPFVSLSASDFSINAASVNETGNRWWTGANPVGVDSEPIADWSPSIGAVQSKAVPFHPVNL